MNVVIVSTAYPLRGGIAHYVALLYRHLSRRHKVNVVTFSRQYPSFLFPGSSQQEKGGGEDVKIPAEQLVDSINPFTWYSAARRIAALKPDVLLFKYWIPFFGPCFGAIARSVKKRTGGATKVVFICDNIVPHEKRPLDGLFTRYAFKAADACIVQSSVVEKDLKRLFPGKPYAHVPHPIYDIFGQSHPKSGARRALGIREENVMLFFGYVRPYKGLDLLLDAMPEVLRSIRVKLLVVGEFYGDEAKTRAKVKKLKLEKSVEIRAEYVPNDKVAPFFSAADVVVLPYLSATQSGIVQIAYNFNRPVIATNVGGLAEVVIDGVTGRIVPPNDPRALAEAIVSFYRKKQEGAFVRGVHVEKKKYSWLSLVQAIESLAKPAREERRGPRKPGADDRRREWKRRRWRRPRRGGNRPHDGRPSGDKGG